LIYRYYLQRLVGASINAAKSTGRVGDARAVTDEHRGNMRESARVHFKLIGNAAFFILLV
jgi:hypothetical protein